MYFSFGSFWNFVFAFLQFEHDMLKYRYFCIYPAQYSMSFLDLWFDVCHWFWKWKTPSHYFFGFFFSFFSLWYSHYTCVILFIIVHTSCISCYFFFSFLFAFPFGKFLLIRLYAHWFSPWPYPIKGMLHFVRVFSISHISFWFFLRVPISLLIWPRCFCMSYIFSTEILIIVILNCLFNFKKIFVRSESGSNDCFLSSGCFFLLFGKNFLLKGRHDILNYGNWGN